MEREEQPPVGPAPTSPRRRWEFGPRAYQIVGFGAAALACLVGLFFFLRVPPPDGQAQDGLALFRDWGKPDLALVVSGQQHGYLQPCGCTHPQKGGLARRYNFLTALRERGWPVAAVDVGDIADLPKKAGPQTLLKYSTSMKALRLMDYLAVGFGKNEMSVPLSDALNHYALNNPTPAVVGTNLLTREKKDDPFHPTVKAWEVGGKGGQPRVGVVGVVGPKVEAEVRDPDVKFHADTPGVLEKALNGLKAQKVELVVLLYQGTPEEAKLCAAFCAKRRQADAGFPRVDVIVCLSEQEEPSGIPEKAGDAILVSLGHKGRYVGVVGAFRSGHAWRLKYQLVAVGPEYETPRGKEAGHPLMELMEEYAREVKDRNLLAEYRQKKHPVQVLYPNAEYVGSSECRGCHRSAYDVWKNSSQKNPKKLGHAHAYETLEKATRPKYRQFDGECIVCHTVGFGYKTGFTDEVKTPYLKGVGCESCHGPCSEHVAKPKDLKIREAINPWRPAPNETEAARTRRMLQIDMFCQTCHDIDNDVHWNFKKWDEIAHPTPRNNGK